MEEGLQFLTVEDCTNFTTGELLFLNLSISITGAVCFLITSLIVLVLIFYKAYHSLLQRLFLYLMLATSIRELALFSLIEHYFYYTRQDELCICVAFFNHWTVTMTLVFAMGIMVYLFYLVRHFAKGNALTVPTILWSKCHRITLECLYIILPVALAFAYASEPYIRGSYGLAGAWCWISSLDENCKLTDAGLLDQLSSYLPILIVGTIGIILMVIITVTYCWLPTTLHEARLLLRKTFIILACLLLFVTLHVINLSIRVYSAKTNQYQHFTMWVLYAMSQSISFLVFPLGFLLCFYSLRAVRLKCYSFCRRMHTCALCFGRFKRERIQFQQQNPALSTLVPTIPKSTRVSPPSSTYFRIPYTNNFTHITTENEPVRGADTGYGSVSQC